MHLTEKEKPVLQFLQDHIDDENPMTAGDIAEALGISTRSAGAVVTSLFKKGLAIRVQGEIELEDHAETIKIIQLTDDGKTFDISTAD